MKPLDRLRSLTNLVGNTPLLAIHFRLDGAERTVYAKAENLNMTDSIKDRMALHILGRAYAGGTVGEGAVISTAWTRCGSRGCPRTCRCCLPARAADLEDRAPYRVSVSERSESWDCSTTTA